MDVFEESYQNIKWDLLSVYKSEYILIYIMGIMWIIWVTSWYLGFRFSILWLIIGFGSVIYGVYILDVLFDEWSRDVFDYIWYKYIRVIANLILCWIIFYFVHDVQVKLFLMLLVSGLIWKVDSRIWAVFALCALTRVIMMLLFDLQTKAESMAVWLYYFLVISVVCGLVWGERKGD